MEAIIGGLFGGLLRFAPEVLKFFDRKGERKHELDLGEQQIKQITAQGSIRMDEKRADFAMAELSAIQEGVKEQGETARASFKIISAISALVRPTVTWGFLALYAAIKVASVHYALGLPGMDVLTALKFAWTADDTALFSMILNFWFVGRVWERAKS